MAVLYALWGTILLLPACAWAGGHTLDLEGVVARALEGGPAVALERQRLARAEGARERAEGAFDWGLYANAGLVRRYVPETQGNLLTTGTTADDFFTTQLGVRKRFRNGVTIRPGVDLYLGNDETTESFGQAVSRPRLNLNVPLMRGAGEPVATAESAAAGALVAAARSGGERAAAEALSEAVIAYWEALAAAERLAALRAAEGPAADFVASLRGLAAQGESSPAAYRQADADLRLRRLELAQAEAALGEARARLALALGEAGDLPPLGGRLPEPGGEAGPGETAALVTGALARRADLAALRHRLEAAQRRLEAARDGLRPKVDLNVDVDHVLLRYEQSLGRRAARGSLAERQAEVEQLRLQMGRLEQEIRGQVRQALARLRTARQTLAQAAESVALYDTVVEDTRRRMRIGEASSSEYSLLQDRLAKARDRLTSARRAYAVGLARLRLATATTGLGEGLDPARVAARFRAW